MGILAVCVAALLVLGSAEAFPSTAEVIPESDLQWSWQDNVNDDDDVVSRGQPELNKLIARKEEEDRKAKETEWQKEGFLAPSVLGVLHTPEEEAASEKYGTVDGHHLISSFLDASNPTSQDDAPKDMLSGLFHDAVKDEKKEAKAPIPNLKKDESSSDALVKSFSEESDDDQHPPPHPLLSLEKIAPKTAKIPEKTPPVKQDAPKDPKLAAIDAKEDKLIHQEMHRDDTVVQPTLTVKQAAATSGASAAADAAVAAKKAVGTLEAMKASADAMEAAARHQHHTPSKAAVAAKIMVEARKSAAKTIARLDKKEAAEQKQKKEKSIAEQESETAMALTSQFLNMPDSKVIPGLINQHRDEAMQHEILADNEREDAPKASAVQKMVRDARQRADKQQKAMNKAKRTIEEAQFELHAVERQVGRQLDGVNDGEN